MRREECTVPSIYPSYSHTLNNLTWGKRKHSSRCVMNEMYVVGNTATGVSNMAVLFAHYDHVMWREPCLF